MITWPSMAHGSPPLPCRASPPQVGRSQAAILRSNVTAKTKREDDPNGEASWQADLPTRGGDARQGRGGPAYSMGPTS
jgi:hypothetical protein